MIKTEFMRLLEELDTITEAASNQAPNLADCRMILSDVKDIRGELEASACLEYNGELTRIQVRTVILRDTERGREFLGQNYGRRVGLPGGGYDMDKDQGDILETAIREAYEEFNLILTDVKDTGIGVWSHRDDPWVTKHVANEEDRWTGYYSYYVTSKVAGNGDNSQPEEINKWTWLPIEKLKFVNKELYAHVNSLEEAIHPDKEARTDIGEISYLCDSLSTLRMILSRMEIQKTYVPEVRYEVGQKNGNTQRIKQMSLSTSRNLLGHAERRPNKWGFGVILDGQELSRYYDIEQYNHADHKLLDLYLTKIVKLTDEAAQQYDGSRVILMLGEYGNRLISKQGDADLKIYNRLMEFLKQSGYLQNAKPLYYYVDYNGKDAWRKAPFGWAGKGKHDSRFINLLPSDIEELYVWPQPFSKYGVPVKAIQEYFHGEFTSMMGTYSSFNEEEERIWVENNLMNFIQIPRPALAGIILPDYFKKDYEQSTPTNYHLAWLKKFVTANNLRVDWHSFVDVDHYETSVNKNDTEEDELAWQEYDLSLSDARIILTRADRAKERFIKGELTKAEFLKDCPPSVIATAAVKLAIEEQMKDLTVDNYQAKYQTALAAAKKYYAARTVTGRLTKKPDEQLEALFNYYCPDPTEASSDEDAFEQDFPETTL